MSVGGGRENNEFRIIQTGSDFQNGVLFLNPSFWLCNN